MNKGYESDLIKSLQVRLMECGLYKSEIDGKWGRESYTGYLKLIGHYSKLYGFPLRSEVTATQEPFEVILSIQCDLGFLNLFDKDFNGIWCRECENAFSHIISLYKVSHHCLNYDFAWSSHVPEWSLHCIKIWLKKNGFKKKIGDYLLTVINFETNGDFFESPFLVSRVHWHANKYEMTKEKLLSLTPYEKLSLLLGFLESAMPKVVTLSELYRSVVPPNHAKISEYEEVLNKLYYEGLLLKNRMIDYDH